MKKLRALSFAVAAAMTVSASVIVSAETFGDVPAAKYSWAVNEINTMASKGIIKGYEDNTFRPERTVTKLEALVLTARVLGVNDSANESVLNAAVEAYGEKIAEYNLSYGSNEVAYLIIKNIISEPELSNYIEASNASSGMKRYEIAVLLTKALDAEAAVSKNVVTSLSYNDAETIPAYAKKYVEYVTNNGLMNGMENNNFSPNTDVTRAQAAVLLYKLIDKTNYTYHNGLVASMDISSRVIKIKNTSDTYQYTVNPSVILRFEGSPITINDIAPGYDSVITLKGDTLYAIDFVTPLLDTEMYGSVASTSTLGEKATISVYEIKENDSTVTKDNKESFSLADNCVITFDNEAASLKDIKTGTYVKLTITQGKVTMISGMSKTSSISGRLSDIQITPVCKLFVELKDGTEAEYLLADEVAVTKNSKDAELSDIVSGDSVLLTTTYGRVSKITATSKEQEKSGIIQEVIISSSPKITLKVGDDTSTYKVSNSCTFKIAGKTDPCFYDLRAGSSAKVTIEGDTIVSIETDVSDGVTQLSGTVTSTNTSYGVIQITYVDSNSGTSVTEPVFVKSKATIIDISTGNTIKLSAINNGAKITAFGSRNSGIFEATTVNVTSK